MQRFSTICVRYAYKSWSIPVNHRAMSTSTASRSWPFAPLDPIKSQDSTKQRLSGIVFDVDGTLCEPQNYMFGEMREMLGIQKGVDILEHLLSLPQPQQDEAFDKVKEIERRAMKKQTPQPGLNQLMDYLVSRDIRKGICTRNFDEPITHLLTTFLPKQVFAPIITRAFHPPKPAPDGILHIAADWKIPAADRGKDLIMVGDSIDDMSAGHSAGATTVLLMNESNKHLSELEQTHFTITQLDQLVNILEQGHVEGH